MSVRGCVRCGVNALMSAPARASVNLREYVARIPCANALMNACLRSRLRASLVRACASVSECASSGAC